jgi:hypothetical protein
VKCIYKKIQKNKINYRYLFSISFLLLFKEPFPKFAKKKKKQLTYQVPRTTYTKLFIYLFKNLKISQVHGKNCGFGGGVIMYILLQYDEP